MKKGLLAAMMFLMLAPIAEAKVTFKAEVVEVARDGYGDGVLKVRRLNGNYVVVKHAQQDESSIWRDDAITISQLLLTRISDAPEEFGPVEFVCQNETRDVQWDNNGPYTEYLDCIFDY